ncbi:MAG TPA: TonB-dependent receptor plug domain-containing protein [Longimicrobium sp.]|nr:TonB-dependent receptor plug domain-containing protein [Longimicrobium sp.]
MARPRYPARISVLVLAAALALTACGRSQPPGEPEPEPPPAETPAGSAGAPDASLSGDDLRDVKVARVEEMLEGRFAGVEVTRLPSGGIAVRIRGSTSVNGSNEPLYVVDGQPVQAEAGGALRWLNPHDVERIQVLKDIGSTSFYGVRGANGVILITTRH